MIVTAIVPAAGLGLRLQSRTPKPLVPLGAKPILIHTLEALSKERRIHHILIAVAKKNWDGFKAVLRSNKIGNRVTLVLGGKTRRESVEHCLSFVSPESDRVLIHDAVRPFIPASLLKALLQKAEKNPAVICGVPVKATIKQATSHVSAVTRNLTVAKTLPRDRLWEIQTPQVFEKDLLRKAYARCKDNAVTDDAALVEKLGVKVRIVRGEYCNIKITTPEDLVFAKAIMDAGYV
ncbi:MAG: 2-C-methyl-D-erythritol 4-phosphate cytidylyltransferase [Omnitrophica WOR_2 bacterium GWF2_43_52]|nr:MAG: 2-C-methyl-D-erythritol 4-phosphate cytidylyltransferase [Omnitrophica WOR_2 bacterium GWF2_43_52]OGX54819.1 MAG: 2-C-methyl-D-erythritol 4-phosphate cytidylyltransferase [Omnitrophica WOR_2 bacterium RIFOXYC2_FULL_43_9]HAH21997.1 2-C-methyl-D-erythritol 4-phosphate cytidylyltransferase [Candidatus Omnitrophota bacterium]HBG62674.1 2-C-methyl-D-erythritol 4-phosphate cytidylyltransferase [Candidatus Omnitrophota bacterium]HCD38917.1 2-C-methyl-D-erythritol 4-phosphate cytidylyltransfera